MAKAKHHAAQEAFARKVLATEAAAVSRIRLDAGFHQAVELILRATGANPSPSGRGQGEGTPGRKGSTFARGPSYSNAPSTQPSAKGRSGGGSVVVTGLGKSNFIGQKISATFASTGTPSHFLHPTEAMHGDLGRIRPGDVVLALSYSGNTEEVVNLALHLRQDALPLIAITGKRDCDLARLAAATLCIGDVTEACPLNLAPTASTTAMLALGDALALSVSRRRGFGVEDFQKVHPGGGLGRQLTPVVEAMRFKAGVNLPLVPMRMTVRQAYAYAKRQARGGRLPGALLIVNPRGLLAGIFTDGDLRRLAERTDAPLNMNIGKVMTQSPRRITSDALVRDAVQLVRELRIDEVPVVDKQGKPLGLIDVQDLVALKVIEG